MFVSIVTPFGEKSFEMGEESALALIRFAQEAGSQAVAPAPAEDEFPAPAWLEVAEDHRLDAEPEPVGHGETHGRSRVESMFGPRDTWDTPAAEEQPDGYTGFLLLRCEECGEVKAFCAKRPITQYRCECGHKTDLHDLLPVYAHCKCGRDSKYKTNIVDGTAVVNCVACGAPIDLELNHRQTAYLTVGVRRGGGTKQPYVFRPNQPLF